MCERCPIFVGAALHALYKNGAPARRISITAGSLELT